MANSTKLGTKNVLVKGIQSVQMRDRALCKGKILMKKRKYIDEILKIFPRTWHTAFLGKGYLSSSK